MKIKYFDIFSYNIVVFFYLSKILNCLRSFYLNRNIVLKWVLIIIFSFPLGLALKDARTRSWFFSKRKGHTCFCSILQCKIWGIAQTQLHFKPLKKGRAFVYKKEAKTRELQEENRCGCRLSRWLINEWQNLCSLQIEHFMKELNVDPEN